MTSVATCSQNVDWRAACASAWPSATCAGYALELNDVTAPEESSVSSFLRSRRCTSIELGPCGTGCSCEGSAGGRGNGNIAGYASSDVCQLSSICPDSLPSTPLIGFERTIGTNLPSPPRRPASTTYSAPSFHTFTYQLPDDWS